MKQVSVGRALDRVDGPLKVTGKAQYAAEIPVANLTHALIVTSGVGRGKLVGVDIGRAEKVAGVLRVLTADNAPRLPGAKTKSDPNDRLLQVLQEDEIHYSDQPIALVVASTLESAQEAANLVSARYASTPVSVAFSSTAPGSVCAQEGGSRWSGRFEPRGLRRWSARRRGAHRPDLHDARAEPQSDGTACADGRLAGRRSRHVV